MTNTNQIQLLLSMLAVQAPILIVSIIACVVILLRWNEAPGGSIWALLGFGLAVFLGLAVPGVQAVVQPWLTQNVDAAHRMLVFTGISMVWSILRALSYIFLLVAVFAGRPAPTTAPPSY